MYQFNFPTYFGLLYRSNQYFAPILYEIGNKRGNYLKKKFSVTPFKDIASCAFRIQPSIIEEAEKVYNFEIIIDLQFEALNNLNNLYMYSFI